MVNEFLMSTRLSEYPKRPSLTMFCILNAQGEQRHKRHMHWNAEGEPFGQAAIHMKHTPGPSLDWCETGIGPSTGTYIYFTNHQSQVKNGTTIHGTVDVLTKQAASLSLAS